MANLNGMGPNNQGPLTGRGAGNCSSNTNTSTKAKVGLGLGMGMGLGMGLARGFRRGFKQESCRRTNGFRMGRQNNFRLQGNNQSTEEYRQFLEEELEQLKNQEETNQ